MLLKKKLGLLSPEEEERLRQLEAKFKMDEQSEIKELGEEEQVEDEDNIFGEQNKLNEEQRGQSDLSQDEMSMSRVHSNISDNENFADLPPIHVMNKGDQLAPEERQKLEEDKKRI